MRHFGLTMLHPRWMRTSMSANSTMSTTHLTTRLIRPYLQMPIGVVRFQVVLGASVNLGEHDEHIGAWTLSWHDLGVLTIVFSTLGILGGGGLEALAQYEGCRIKRPNTHRV